MRRQRNVTVWMDEATAIDVAAHRVSLGLRTLDWDWLVVATGSTHAYFGHDDWAPYAPGLKTMDDAFLIRRRILSAFEAAECEADAGARSDWLSFVIVGAGPTGVELAGTLAEMAQHTLSREFRLAHTPHARIHLMEAGPRVLPGMPARLSRLAQRRLERLGVEVHLGTPVTAVDADGVTIGTGHVRSRCVLWAAGVAASPLGAGLGAGRDRAGRVAVAPDLSLPGHAEVFVIGDLAAVTCAGRRVPGVAPAAKQMGSHVARAIRARLAGRVPAPFRYRDAGSLACISRSAAVVDLRGFQLSGLAGWWFWLVAHIFFLIGFRNRLAVMWNWAWSYLSWQRGARIIVGHDEAQKLMK